MKAKPTHLKLIPKPPETTASSIKSSLERLTTLHAKLKKTIEELSILVKPKSE